MIAEPLSLPCCFRAISWASVDDPVVADLFYKISIVEQNGPHGGRAIQLDYIKKHFDKVGTAPPANWDKLIGEYPVTSPVIASTVYDLWTRYPSDRAYRDFIKFLPS